MKLAVLSDGTFYKVNDDQRVGNIFVEEDGRELEIVKLLPLVEMEAEA